ncbi:hypothetical protein Noda2021_11060 [Candidatus Dependentiae bacterium Noda2021]|nr:hypothetical protein Noda2021_11060 [Candidatus Dependentiae bacterium Noda2021]
MFSSKLPLYLILLTFMPYLEAAPAGVHVPTQARTETKTRLKRSTNNDLVQIEKQKPTTFWGKLAHGVKELFVVPEYVSDITIAELKKNKDEAIKSKDRDTALHYLEKLIPLCDELHDARELTLQKADLLFELERYSKAEPVYRLFIELYPGSDQISQARYNLLMCVRKQMLGCDRDQTKTEETLKLAQETIDLPECLAYKAEIEKIITDCYLQLAERELYVADFYFKQNKLVTASKRLESARTDYLSKASRIEPELLSREALLAEMQNDNASAAKKRYELVTRFPEHPVSVTFVKQKSELEQLLAGLDKSLNLPSDTIVVAQATPKSFTERF